MTQERKMWPGLISVSGLNTNNLVFLYESGCNTDMTRRYAYSFGGSRAVDSIPLSKPKNTAILSSIQLDETTQYTTFSGGTTEGRFKDYLMNTLLLTMNGDFMLIMDNMKSYNAKGAKERLAQSGIHYLYLLPYRPDLIPIVKLWSKMKALLYKFKARTLDELPEAIKNAFLEVALSDCVSWFRSCGYVQ